MASEIRVNSISSRSGLSTITFGAYGVEISGITTIQQLKVSSGTEATFAGVVTATSFAGAGVNITGVVTATSYQGDGSALTGIDATTISNGTSNVTVSAGSSITFTTDGTLRASIGSTGHFLPASNNVYDLGNPIYRWRNVYTNDLNLNNEGFINDVDGTWGKYTIQEGENDLFLINRRTGKKYKFMLEEVK